MHLSNNCTGKSWSGIFVLLVSLATCLSVTAQPSRFLKWTGTDARELVSTLGQRAPVYLIAGSSLLIPGTRLDSDISAIVKRNTTSTSRHILDGANRFGSPLIAVPVTGLFGISLLTEDLRFQDASFTALQSLYFATALTLGVKYLFGRHRPNTGSSPENFSPLSRNDSFPSGHVTTAFAIATSWALYYPSPLSYSLYVISTGTAIARIERDKHWATDVLAGAAIGLFTARWLVRRHRSTRTITYHSVDADPVLTRNGSGLLLTISL